MATRFDFSTSLNCFEEILSWHSKNVFVLILAHLEPQLELCEVDDFGDDGDDDLLHHYLLNFTLGSFPNKN